MTYTMHTSLKESHVEWLGSIPEHWRCLQIKRLTKVARGASPRPIDDPKYFDDEGEYAWVRIADVTSAGATLERTTQRLSSLGSSLSVKLEPGELFLSIAGTVGKPCITQIRACIHDGFVYFPHFSGDKKFLFYIFAAGEAYKGLGKMGTQLNLNTDTVGWIKIGLPPLPEQKAIARFLDHETAKIDQLIAKQERLIELLKEKRQAVISHAVTKGLNPDAKMKDSDVEWLGEVPEHWAISQFKFSTSEIQTGPFGSQLHAEDYVENGIPLINPAHIINGELIPAANCSVDQTTQERLARHKLSEGDLILARRGELGRCAVVRAKQAGWLCGTGSLRATLKPTLNTEYAYMLISSEGVKVELSLESKGSTMDNLNTETLGKIRLPVPPTDEQQAILLEVHKISAKFNKILQRSHRQIELMKERRSALISAAVTGKIDVRDWQPQGSSVKAETITA